MSRKPDVIITYNSWGDMVGKKEKINKNTKKATIIDKMSLINMRKLIEKKHKERKKK